MVTEIEVAEIALALPGAHQGQHFETVDFRVDNHIFCTLPAEPGLMALRLDVAEQSALIEENPDTYRPGPGKWGAHGWTRVTLTTADAVQLRELITEAWRRRAPASLLRELEESGT